MDVKLPKLGEGADSGVVVGIFVKEGDTVAKDQAILELENEKAVASIPSTAAGVVEKIHVKAGDRVGVGQRADHAGWRSGSGRRRSCAAAGAETGGEKSCRASCAGTGRGRRGIGRRVAEEVPNPVAAPVASPSHPPDGARTGH